MSMQWDSTAPNDLQGKRYRPHGRRNPYRTLYNREWNGNIWRPIFDFTPCTIGGGPPGSVKASFRCQSPGILAIADLSAYYGAWFANKATVLYSHGFARGMRDRQFFPVFETWKEATSDCELARPRYCHYPLVPVLCDRSHEPPSLPVLIDVHEALSKRVQQLEGQIYGPCGDNASMRVRDPFARCLIWSEVRPDRQPPEEFWLVAEKQLVGPIGEAVHTSPATGEVWVAMKMDLKDAILFILYLPVEKLRGDFFRVRWETGEMEESFRAKRSSREARSIL